MVPSVTDCSRYRLSKAICVGVSRRGRTVTSEDGLPDSICKRCYRKLESTLSNEISQIKHEASGCYRRILQKTCFKRGRNLCSPAQGLPRKATVYIQLTIYNVNTKVQMIKLSLSAFHCSVFSCSSHAACSRLKAITASTFSAATAAYIRHLSCTVDLVDSRRG